TNCKCLNWNSNYALLFRGPDFRGGRKSGPQILWWAVECYHYFEVLRFLSAGSSLRSCQTGAPQHRLRANLGHFPVKSLARNCIDRHVRFLPHAHVYDVRFIDLHFRSDDGHIGKSHQKAAVGVLDAGNDVFAKADWQIADNSVDWRGVRGLIQNV